MEAKFPPLTAPSSFSCGADAESRGDPRATGVRVGGQVGVESARAKEPRCLGSCRISPPPLCTLWRPRTALDRSPWRERDPVFLPAQDPPDIEIWTKKPGCSGRARGPTALVWQVNTRGQLATTLPILPRLPSPGRDTPFPLSRLSGDAAAALRDRGPRGSDSRLTGSGELDSDRAPARARRPPQTASGAGSALLDRLAKSARGTAQSRTGPESQ